MFEVNHMALAYGPNDLSLVPGQAIKQQHSRSCIMRKSCLPEQRNVQEISQLCEIKFYVLKQNNSKRPL